MNNESKGHSVPLSTFNIEIHQGQLMAPEDALGIVSEERMRQHVIDEQPWFLFGESPQGMRQKIAEDVPTGIHVWVRGDKVARYLVIAHQTDSLQHRFVLPLYEPKVKSFVASCLLQPCWFSLGDSGDTESVVLPLQLPRTLCIELITKLQNLSDEERKVALIALRPGIRRFAEIGAFPSLTEGVDLEQVSVSYVPPMEALALELGDLLGATMVKH